MMTWGSQLCKWWVDEGLDKIYKLPDLRIPTTNERSDLSSGTDPPIGSPPNDPHALQELMANALMYQSLSHATSQATATSAPELPEAVATAATDEDLLNLPMATATAVLPASAGLNTDESGHAGDQSSIVTSELASCASADEIATGVAVNEDEGAVVDTAEDNGGGTAKEDEVVVAADDVTEEQNADGVGHEDADEIGGADGNTSPEEGNGGDGDAPFQFI